MQKLLIVDDSLFQRNRIKEAVTGCGLPLEEARNGREGLEKLAGGNIACVISDLVMPEMDGFEFLEKATKRQPGVPVIVLTADIQHTTQSRCMALGAVAVLNKPAPAGELRAAVDRCLAGTAVAG